MDEVEKDRDKEEKDRTECRSWKAQVVVMKGRSQAKDIIVPFRIVCIA